MKKGLSLPMSVAVGLLPVTISFLIYQVLCRSAGTMELKPIGNADELVKAAVDFAKDLQALTLAAMGALGAFLFKISEQKRLAPLGHGISVLSLGFLTAAIYLGYEAQVSALRLWGDTGAIKVDEGPYHWGVAMQIVMLALGAACYGLLVLCLIQPPSRND